MKKIIQGKLYNTETATECGYRKSKHSITDFNWFEETLYRKKTDEFFLCGEGNGASKYAHGRMIIPITLKEAKSWVESYLEVEDYIELFGDVEE